jgi:hypothetical protein
MRFFKILVLLQAFCLDVHVRAQTLERCNEGHVPCAMQATRRAEVLKDSQWRLSMSEGAIVQRRNRDLTELVNGEFYLEISRPMEFASPYGHFWCVSQCKALIERTATSFVLQSLEGQWRLRRTGEAQEYALAPGLQIHLGEVASDGHAEMEYPQSLPWQPTVDMWASLYPGKLKDLKPTLVKFREVWRAAVESVSQLHSAVASREIASYQKGLADEQVRRQRREQEDQRLRQLFRDKNP